MAAKQQPAIRIQNVYKDFVIPHERSNSLKSMLLNPRARKVKDVQHSLNNVSLEIPKGEFFGIIGKNGGGKSTLLKVIAEVYRPTSGSVEVNGSLIPFIELGVGFNMDLSGRDNVYMNGALLGFSRKEIEVMYDDIVGFAELEQFMDQKLKNYSSGMQVRLAFSIAIRAKSDILLIDEVLAVGDANFQRKCFEYFDDIKRTGKTVVFVSHDMASVSKYCDRVAYIHKGKIQATGSAEEMIARYTEEQDRELTAADRKTIKSISGEEVAAASEIPAETVGQDSLGERLVPEGNERSITYAEHMARYMSVQSLVQDRTVVDLGCGAGYGSVMMAKTAKQVDGLDISPLAIEYAAEQYGPQAKNVSFAVEDATKGNGKAGSYDVAVAFELLNHLEKPEKLITESKRLLQKNGVMVLSAANVSQFMLGNRYHKTTFSLAKLERLLRKHFKSVELYYQNDWLGAGLMSGTSMAVGGATLPLDSKKAESYEADEAVFFVAVCSDRKTLPKLDEQMHIADTWSLRNNEEQERVRREEKQELLQRIKELEAKKGSK